MGIPEKQPEPADHPDDWANFADHLKSDAPTGAEQVQGRDWVYESDRERVWPLGDTDPNTEVSVRARAFEAVYDGKVIVPTQAADLPLGRPMVLVYSPIPASLDTREQLDEYELQQRQAARARLADLLKDVPHVPLTALRAED